MIQTRLKGMGVALITPFKEDDSVDYDALLRLVDYQLQNGTDFLCVLGTTAETPTLTKEEKDKIKRLIIERVNGRIPILLVKPDVLFLDEATSALDEQSEALLYRLLRQELPQTIMVSVGHRSTLNPFHEKKLLWQENGQWQFA
jgi:hypothetical protein